MTTEITTSEPEAGKVNVKVQSASDAVYGLGMIGAWVFYIGRARTPKEGVVGFLKGLVWPAFLVFEVLKLLSPEAPDSSDLPLGDL
jgi:hypothetical protein